MKDLACAVKGHPLQVVTSDAFTREKLEYMKRLGADLQIVPSESGHMTEHSPGTRSKPPALSPKTREALGPTSNDTDQLTTYHQLAGQVDGFVESLGTAASHRGTGEGLAAITARSG